MAPESVVRAPSPIRHALLTGVTGFVGQAVLERLLSDPSKPRITVLVRTNGGLSADARIANVLNGPAFGPWRERGGPTAITDALAHRLEVIDADLSSLPDLPSTLDVVIHAAASVKFDARVDHAFLSNVEGPAHLYEALLRSASTPHVIHVSTCYVHATRVANAPEGPVTHGLDWHDETQWARRVTADARREALENHHDERWLTATLSEVGRDRAREHGWTDIYTMTKTLGEDVAVDLWHRTGHSLSIVRPAIIESAYALPYPGWIDGFKVADPLIAAFAKGRFSSFPGTPETVLDIIPVDFVASAIMATATHQPVGGEPTYVHVGSGRTNPISLGEFTEIVHQYLVEQPWNRWDGTVVEPRLWRFVAASSVRRRTTAALTALVTANWLCSLPLPLPSQVRPTVQRHLHGLRKLRTYMGLYSPYTSSPTTYADTGLRSLHNHVMVCPHASEVERHQTDVSTIDWGHYLHQVHLPSLMRMMYDHDAAQHAAVEVAAQATELPLVMPTQATQVGPSKAFKSPKSAGVASTR